jgi:hypothetical protein
MEIRRSSGLLLVRDAEIDALLAVWGRDPRSVMNQLPEKRDWRTGRVLERPPSAFDASELLENRFVDLRDQTRMRMWTQRDGRLIRLAELPSRPSPASNDEWIEKLANPLHSPLFRRLDEMEAEELTVAQLKSSPWSDSYWPGREGLAGVRYADPERPAGDSHEMQRLYVTERPLADIARDGIQSEIDLLSPAEKYDLLLGHLDTPLTRTMWRMGRADFERNGKAETWKCLAHGWAPASFMMPRPRRTVVLPGPDARFIIPFLPSDLKALGSLLWATTSPPIHFVGGCCNEPQPELDENGRIAGPFVMNAGLWHQIVVHQLGVERRSLIIDATYDPEVWNQPLFEYFYSYFNPLTRQATRTLQNAAVKRQSLVYDPFKRYRTRQGVSIVGIAMDVTCIAAVAPNHNFSNSSDDDRRMTLRYLYDLELDDRGQIVGGEWYTNRPPDFLWAPAAGTRPSSDAEQLATGGWNQARAIPESWRQAARAAAEHGQPLEKIVSALFELVK